MEQFYKDARTPLRMRNGTLGAYVDEFVRQLSEDGYARFSPAMRCNWWPIWGAGWFGARS